MTIRCFIALSIPEQTASILTSHAQAMSAASGGKGLRWVKQGNYHLTLAFLGEIPSQKAQAIQARLGGVLEQYSPFDLNISGIGGFPLGNRPTTISALVEESKELSELVQRIRAEVEQEKVQLEKRRFKPHITLARIKSGKFDKRLLEPKMVDLGFCVESIDFFQSELRPSGPIYHLIERFKLASHL